jgi:hypothetical protein
MENNSSTRYILSVYERVIDEFNPSATRQGRCMHYDIPAVSDGDARDKANRLIPGISRISDARLKKVTTISIPL